MFWAGEKIGTFNLLLVLIIWPLFLMEYLVINVFYTVNSADGSYKVDEHWEDPFDVAF